MLRHWLIRHANKDEYVPTTDGKGSQLEQVIKYCVLNRYALGEVIVLETATDKCRKKLKQFIKEYLQ